MSQGYINPDNQPDKIRWSSINPSDSSSKRGVSLNDAAITYAQVEALNELDQAIIDTSKQTSSLSSPAPVGESLSIEPGDLTEDLDSLLEILEKKGYQNNPAAFFEKLAEVGIEISNLEVEDIGVDEIKSELIAQLRSRFNPFFENDSSKEALGIALAQAYRALSNGAGGAKDLDQLKGMLGVFLGYESPIVDSTVEIYKNAINSGGEIPNIKESQDLLVSQLDGLVEWGNNYDDLMNELLKGNVPFDLLVKVLSNVPSDAESVKKMNELMKGLGPLFDNGGNNSFIRALALHFANISDEAGTFREFEEFMEKLKPFIDSSTFDDLTRKVEYNLKTYWEFEGITQDKINQMYGQEIIKLQTEVGAEIKSSLLDSTAKTSWNQKYDEIMNELHNQRLPFSQLIPFLMSNPQDPELKQKLQDLVNSLAPLLEDSKLKLDFSKALALYFTHIANPEASYRDLEDFFEALSPLVDQMGGDFGHQLNALYGKILYDMGTYWEFQGFDQNKIDTMLDNLLSDFEGLAGASIKSYLDNPGSIAINWNTEFEEIFQELRNGNVDLDRIMRAILSAPQEASSQEKLKQLTSFLKPFLEESNLEGFGKLIALYFTRVSDKEGSIQKAHDFVEKFQSLMGQEEGDFAKLLSIVDENMSSYWGDESVTQLQIYNNFSSASRNLVENTAQEVRELARAGTTPIQSWEDDYNALMNELKDGKVDFNLLMQVLQNAPDGPEFTNQVKALAEKLHFLLDDSYFRTDFDRAVALYFTKLDDEAGSKERAEAFVRSLGKYFNDPNNDLDKMLQGVQYNMNTYWEFEGNTQDKIDSMLNEQINKLEKKASDYIIFSESRGGSNPIKNWDQAYDQLIKDLKKGKVPFNQLIQVLMTGIEGHKDPQKLKALTDLLKPLLDDTDNRNTLARMLSLYFTNKEDQNGSIKNVEDFLNSLVLYYAKNEDDPYFGKLADLLVKTKENINSYYTSDEYDQAWVNSELAAGQATFEKAVGVSIKNYNVIHTAPIMMAIFIVLMSEDGSYGYLAKIMGNLNKTMKEIAEFTDTLEDINNALDQFMQAETPEELREIATRIRDDRNKLSELIEQKKGALSDDLLERLKQYADPAKGSIDKMVEGVGNPAFKTWDDVLNDDEGLQNLKNYMTNLAGGQVPAPVNTVITNTSNLLGALNTQNSAQLQRLNMTTKKVDSLTKLFSASMTMYKGIIQTLTQYSGA